MNVSKAEHRDADPDARAEFRDDGPEHVKAMAWLDDLEPETTPADNTEDLARVGAAALSLAHDERTLEEAIRTAREHGRSWTEIAVRLGVSRQAARQRYGAQAGV